MLKVMHLFMSLSGLESSGPIVQGKASPVPAALPQPPSGTELAGVTPALVTATKSGTGSQNLPLL